jgi:hypothetical protein
VVRCSTTPQLVREVAQKVSDFAGDGARTATVLVQSIVRRSEMGRRQHATKIPSVHYVIPASLVCAASRSRGSMMTACLVSVGVVLEGRTIAVDTRR